MSLKDIKDNRRVAEKLSAIMVSGRLVHAFLFTGPEGPRLELGRAFAKALLCGGDKGDSCGSCPSCIRFDSGNDPDYIEISRSEGRQSIVAEQIEDLQNRLKFVPFGERQVALIDGAQAMNQAAQNKLLKTLEEPSPGTVIILLADTRDGLLPTIISRCSVYSLAEAELNEPGEYRKMAAAFTDLILDGAKFYEKKECLKPVLAVKEEARTRAEEFVDALEEELGKRLSELARGKGGSGAGRALSPGEMEKLTDAVRLCESSRRKLRVAYNPAYLLKGMCLKL